MSMTLTHVIMSEWSGIMMLTIFLLSVAVLFLSWRIFLLEVDMNNTVAKTNECVDVVNSLKGSWIRVR